MLDPDGAARFLARDWQRQPRFFEAALPHLPATPPWRDWLGDAHVESRRVTTRGDGRYTLEHGPFHGPDPDLPWTALFSDAEQHAPALGALLEAVAFLPRWRLDDVMLSVATDGASVGPHVDAYDVFLVQAEGTRRWSLGTAGRCEPDPAGESLRLVRPFDEASAVVAHPGDVLYLPPGVPHHGVADGPCMTYSIGLRAPRLVDLAAVVLESRAAQAHCTDPGREPAASAAALDRATVRAVRAQLEAFLSLDDDAVARALGCLVTEPKEWLLDADATATDADALGRRLAAGGVTVRAVRAARFAFDDASDPPRLFANGRCHDLSPDTAGIARALADRRQVRVAAGGDTPALRSMLTDLIDDAAVYLSDE